MTKILDAATVGVMVVALFIVIGLSLIVGVGLFRSQLMRDNVVRRTETEKEPDGKIRGIKVIEERSNVSNVKELFPLIEASLVFAGFAATIYQLRESRRQQKQADDWKRAEFVTSELRQFSNDPAVVNTKRILESIDAEYDPRLLLDIAPEKGGPVKQEEHPISKQELVNGLTPDPGPFYSVETGEQLDKTRLTPLENKIAYELDEYLTYMVNFRKLLRDGLLTTRDLEPYLNYWFQVILEPQEEAATNPQTVERAKRLRSALHTYLRNYYTHECRFIAVILDRKLSETPLALESHAG